MPLQTGRVCRRRRVARAGQIDEVAPSLQQRIVTGRPGPATYTSDPACMMQRAWCSVWDVRVQEVM